MSIATKAIRKLRYLSITNHPSFILMRLRTPRKWNAVAPGVHVRGYSASGFYHFQQRLKTRIMGKDYLERDRQLTEALSYRAAWLPIDLGGRSVLCLGARHGGEVRAFLSLGCTAVGLDLEPGDPSLVLRGDFHHIPFPDKSFDAVYTNSLDHTNNPELLLSEIRRVARQYAFIEAQWGTTDLFGAGPGPFEACWWSRVSCLWQFIGSRGFTLLAKSAIAYPWPGEYALWQVGEMSELAGALARANAGRGQPSTG